MFRRPCACASQRVCTLERRQDALVLAALAHGAQRLLVASCLVTDPPHRVQQRMLRADSRIVEACGYGVGLLDLSLGILQQQ